jgi:hypothetical protein
VQKKLHERETLNRQLAVIEYRITFILSYSFLRRIYRKGRVNNRGSEDEKNDEEQHRIRRTSRSQLIPPMSRSALFQDKSIRLDSRLRIDGFLSQLFDPENLSGTLIDNGGCEAQLARSGFCLFVTRVI